MRLGAPHIKPRETKRVLPVLLPAHRTHLGVGHRALVEEAHDGAEQQGSLLRQAEHADARHPLHQDGILPRDTQHQAGGG